MVFDHFILENGQQKILTILRASAWLTKATPGQSCLPR
jgi:hypothetical protein